LKASKAFSTGRLFGQLFEFFRKPLIRFSSIREFG
jgi:hypothetical protein